ncbi:MAG: TRAP transporter small permease [Spirochaetaceae bacterium]|jgi:TRAP-type C4-dicarboxylate transport system permease small subunit|nr:TRAP transporter small permease [Spirochaetaceae bacterium]
MSKKPLDALFRGVEILIAVFLAVMIFLVFMNVVCRYVFSKGFAWSEEIARLCFIYLVYLGAIGAARDNRHLLVESVLSRVPPVAQKTLYLLAQGIIIWLMATLAIGSFTLAKQNLNDRMVATGYPVFLIHSVGVVSGLAIIIIALANIYRLFALKMSVTALITARDSDSVE